MTDTALPFPVADRMVWSVTALCAALSDALEARFNPVTVRGELAAFTRAASGHCYFTISDAHSQLKGAMFRRAASLLDFRPRIGSSVEIRGRLNIYGARGELQMIAESMCETGSGKLYEQFVRLKAELQAEGLFAAERKKPLPDHPAGVGIVTSLSAAALHDICVTLSQRAPHIPVIISPAAVQGKHAPQELIDALEKLCIRSDISSIIIARGGGSAEDLWAFNDPDLARCIAHSPLPVITGIGHETDFTIADFCADHRAATPTAAAETATPSRQHLLHILQQQQQRLFNATIRSLENRQQNLDHLASRLKHPAHILHTRRQYLQHMANRLNNRPQQLLTLQQHRLRTVERMLHNAIRANRIQQHNRLNSLASSLDLLNPMRVVARGYSIVSSASGETITRTGQVSAGEKLRISLYDGSIGAQVQSVSPAPELPLQRERAG